VAVPGRDTDAGRGRSTTDAGSTTGRVVAALAAARPVTGLLLAWKPDEASTAGDRMPIERTAQVGRAGAATWTVLDGKLSKVHFEVSPDGDGATIRDLESTNGTFVNGLRLGGAHSLEDQDVVRAGRCVFVFSADVARLSAGGAEAARAHGLAGPFHSPALVAALDEAVRTGRHLLIEGESGVGKELFARAAHRMASSAAPFVAHNCARFASAEEAETTLFGVVRGVFTGVDARAGLIEEAEGGVLYLDELPNLPARVQRSLLRFAEDGEFCRIGETKPRQASLRLVLGTNRPVEAALADGTLAHDLVARTHRLRIPPLAERRADVPAIFVHALREALGRRGLQEAAWKPLLAPDYIEAVVLHDHGGANVRFLEDLAATIGARLSRAPAGEWPRALAALFADRLRGSPVLARYAAESAGPPGHASRKASPYEAHREEILAAYRDCGGNLSAMEAALRERGLAVHRRWLAEFLDRWGVRSRRGRGT
jgi:DNA-binding NtrC family response regulator